MRKKYKQMVCTAAAAVFMSSTCLAANPDIAYKEAVQTMYCYSIVCISAFPIFSICCRYRRYGDELS